MRLIGYFDGKLTIAEIQEISVGKSSYGHEEKYEIQARSSSGAMTSVYCIRPSDSNNTKGFYLFETQEEANCMLERILVDPETIDLRKLGDFFCQKESHLSSVLISNEWDEIFDREQPIVVKIIDD